MHDCSRLQPILLNQKDICWLLKPPTTLQSEVDVGVDDYRRKQTKKAEPFLTLPLKKEQPDYIQTGNQPSGI
jgi:hypothetical protein